MLSEEDQKDIELSIREIREGRYCTVEDLMKADRASLIQCPMKS